MKDSMDIAEKLDSRVSNEHSGVKDRLLYADEATNGDILDLTEQSKHDRRRWHSLPLYLLCVALGIFLGTAFTVVLRAPHHDHHPNLIPPSRISSRLTLGGLHLDCGSSDNEAKANGCIFDVMVYAWIPPACYERDLAEEVIDPTSHLAEYRAAGVFEWHAGPNFTQPLPQDANVLQEYDTVWATMKWHQAHCLYFWRLLTRAVLRSSQDGWEYAYVLSLGTDWPHTLHCNRVLGDRLLPDNDQIRTLKFYGRCQRIDMLPDGYLEHGTLIVDPEGGA